MRKARYDIAVAAAVRSPWEIRSRRIHKDFPPGFVLKKRKVERAKSNGDQDDVIEVLINIFARSIIQLTVGHKDHPDTPGIEVFCVHLKSKLSTRLDREERDNPEVRAHAAPLGAAISMIRRTAESAPLRSLLNGVMRDTDTPVGELGIRFPSNSVPIRA